MANELNVDQIRRIEAKINCLHKEWEWSRWEDPEGYEYLTGRSDGIIMMLNELGYEVVWNEETESFSLRRNES